MLRLSLVLMLFMGSPARAGDAFYTGNKLFSRCNDDDITAIACLGYVQAVFDTLSGGDVILGWKACPPENVTGKQIKDIVVRFLVNHPEKRHYAATGLAAHALSEAFPCP